MAEETIILHRDDPDKDPLVGHVKVTRDDWINVARYILVNEGISQVKVLTISERLEVSRSSFYWYFESRTDLLNALLDDWEKRNTATIIKHCDMEAATIGIAICSFFRCFVDPHLFDRGLDFAVREWSRQCLSVSSMKHTKRTVGQEFFISCSLAITHWTSMRQWRFAWGDCRAICKGSPDETSSRKNMQIWLSSHMKLSRAWPEIQSCTIW